MAAETIEIDIMLNLRNNTSAGMNNTRQAIDRVTESTQRARREIDRLDGTRANPTVSVIDKASSTLSTIDRGLKGIGRAVIKTPVKILDYATRPLRMIKDSLFSIKGLVMTIGAGWAANKLFSEPIGLADSYTSAKIGFSNLLGDDEGQKMMDKLDDFAKRTPFKTSGVIDNAQKMMAMGWDPTTIIEDMETIGNAAAATGKMDQGLESIVRALAQIKTKGKLSTEELNQLSEAGIAAKAMLAEQLGYGTGDKGIAAMTKDLEKGLIGSEVAVKALLQGMKQFDGTMEKTANETVEGLKSQIQDAFEINILRRWGQGLQDGAKRGFGSIVELLDKSEGTLEKFGDTVYEIGKELSNWAADKLEGTIDKILRITNRSDFKNASIGGKIKILWDEVIAQPFSKWWDSKGKPYITEKMNSLGKALGAGISNVLIGASNAILSFLGMDTIEGESKSIGGGFADGFLEGFKGKKVWEAMTKAIGAGLKEGFKALFQGNALSKIIATGLSIKIASGILKGINAVQTFWSGTGATTGDGGNLTLAGMGLKGVIGSASNGTGILGFGANTAIKLGAGNLAGGASMSSGALSALGLGATAGAVGTVAGLGNATSDLISTFDADSNNDKKRYKTRAATKFGMVGTGAAAGAAIGSIIPGVGTLVGGLIGGGIGGIATYVAGDKLADSISGITKSTAELNEEAEKLAAKRIDKKFGDITLSAEKLSRRVKEVFGADSISRVQKFNQSLSDLDTISDSVLNFKNDINYTSARINAGETLSESDVASYQASLEGYAESVSQLLQGRKNTSISAFKLLWGDDTKGLQSITEGINETYTKLETELAKKSGELNKVIADAFSDGKIDIDEEKKINELVEQIEKIQDKVDERIRQKEQEKNNAKSDLIGLKYKDTDLTADSFKDLISELDSQSEESLKAYDDAFIEAQAELNVELKTGEINDKEYREKLKEIENKWREGKAITIRKKVNVTFDVLEDKYGDELINMSNTLAKVNPFSKEQLETVNNSTRDLKTESIQKRGGFYNGPVINWTKDSKMDFEDMKDSWLKGIGVDKAAQKELAEMYNSLKPQEEDLLELKKSYEQAGKEIPKWITDSLADISNIKLMSGDMDSFYKIVGEQLAKDDPAYAKALKKAKEQGQDIPKALIDGVNKGLKETKVETKELEVDTNLKLNADKTNIDTSDLDLETKKVIEKMKAKEVLFVQDGKVKIKTKDGKVDTSNLDEGTKKAIEKLEKEGAITINKDGTVVFNTTVDSTSADEKVKNTEDKLSSDSNLNKTANIDVSATTTGEEAAANGSYSETKTAVDTAYGKDLQEKPTVNITGLGTTGAGAAISSAWESFKSWVKEKFNKTIKTTTTISIGTVIARRFGSAPTSKEDAEKTDGKKANGGYVDRAIKTIVGEAGPEMIIPLSANRRQRGKSLWERAGRAMGLFGASSDEKVYMNANGGLYGLGASKIDSLNNSGTSKLQSLININRNTTEHAQNNNSTGKGNVKVDVGGVQIVIQSSGNGVGEDIQKNADYISGQIAEILQQAFQNMPIPELG